MCESQDHTAACVLQTTKKDIIIIITIRRAGLQVSSVQYLTSNLGAEAADEKLMLPFLIKISRVNIASNIASSS